MKLDAIDCRILEILQTDNRIANVRLAEAVGLSAPACSRRVSRLRAAGVIVKDVAVLDPQMAGGAVSVFVTVRLATRRQEAIEAFTRRMRARPEVQLCFVVAGSIDFVVLAVLPDVASYAGFAAEVFAGDESVQAYESWFVLSRVKQETRIDLSALIEGGGRWDGQLG